MPIESEPSPKRLAVTIKASVKTFDAGLGEGASGISASPIESAAVGSSRTFSDESSESDGDAFALGAAFGALDLVGALLTSAGGTGVSVGCPTTYATRVGIGVLVGGGVPSGVGEL